MHAIETVPNYRRGRVPLSQLALSAAMLMVLLGAGAGAAWLHAHKRPIAEKVTPTAKPTPWATPSGFPVPSGSNFPTKASPVPVATLPRASTGAQPLPSASASKTPTPPPSGFVPPGPVPDASAGSAVGYYAPGGYPILVNQQFPAGGGSAVFTTWKWDGIRWVKLFEGSNTPYASGNMAYDPAIGMTVVGSRGWNGSAWVSLPAVSVTGQPYLAFDAARNQLVLLDSNATGAVTWTFDGKTWKQANSSPAPAQHYGAGFAYDPRNRVIVLVGGHSSGGFASYNDTWTWDGNSWTQQHPASSPPGGNGTMAFDDATQQMVLLEESGTTWTWSGSTWTRLASAATPPFGAYAGMVFDSVHQDLFLWEGAGGYESSSQTWTYANGLWVRRS